MILILLSCYHVPFDNQYHFGEQPQDLLPAPKPAGWCSALPWVPLSGTSSPYVCSIRICSEEARFSPWGDLISSPPPLPILSILYLNTFRYPGHTQPVRANLGFRVW